MKDSLIQSLLMMKKYQSSMEFIFRADKLPLHGLCHVPIVLIGQPLQWQSIITKNIVTTNGRLEGNSEPQQRRGENWFTIRIRMVYIS
jgi:hypothetical protein